MLTYDVVHDPVVAEIDPQRYNPNSRQNGYNISDIHLFDLVSQPASRNHLFYVVVAAEEADDAHEYHLKVLEYVLRGEVEDGDVDGESHAIHQEVVPFDAECFESVDARKPSKENTKHRY